MTVVYFYAVYLKLYILSYSPQIWKTHENTPKTHERNVKNTMCCISFWAIGSPATMTAGIGELVGGSQREERIEACRRAKQKLPFRTLMASG